MSAGSQGKVVMKNCFSDVAYDPVFNLTRGSVPEDASYEVTILSPAKSVKPTPRTSLGVICGVRCTFILRDGTTGPLPAEVNHLTCGGKKPLTDSSVTNHTRATLTLEKNVKNCVIRSVGRVLDEGKHNTVVRIKPK